MGGGGPGLLGRAGVSSCSSAAASALLRNVRRRWKSSLRCRAEGGVRDSKCGGVDVAAGRFRWVTVITVRGSNAEKPGSQTLIGDSPLRHEVMDGRGSQV